MVGSALLIVLPSPGNVFLIAVLLKTTKWPDLFFSHNGDLRKLSENTVSG